MIIRPMHTDMHPSDNSANREGYTRHMLFEHGALGGDIAILVKPGADLYTNVKGFDTDNQVWVIVEGWRGTWSES